MSRTTPAFIAPPQTPHVAIPERSDFGIAPGFVRRVGSAALDLAYVACGRFDAYWEYSVKPWDVSAGWLLVEEAGGRVTRIDGTPYSLHDTSQTLATNGRLHTPLVRLLK